MNARIVVVGSINIDESISVHRYPAPGETTTATSAIRTLGGKGANQAVAAARAGGTVTMVGAVGTDDPFARHALDVEQIDTSAIATVPEPATGRAIVVVDEAGENSIVVIPGANATISSHLIEDAVRAMEVGDTLVLQNEISPEDSALAARLAHERGASVIWNAAPAPRDRNVIVADVDILVVNEQELEQIASLVDLDADDIDGAMTAVADALRTDVVCTLGASGVVFRDANGSGSVPAHSVHAVDTTAAGDTFVGYLAANATLPLDERLRLAVAASAITVTRPGAATSIPTRQDVDEFVVAADAQTRTNA